MNCSADLGGCYPPRPLALEDNTLLDLQNNFSYPSQPHLIIIMLLSNNCRRLGYLSWKKGKLNVLSLFSQICDILIEHLKQKCSHKVVTTNWNKKTFFFAVIWPCISAVKTKSYLPYFLE